MSLDSIELAPSSSFKPIDFEPSSSCDSFDVPVTNAVSPTEIFRYTAVMDEDTEMAKENILSVRRANPIGVSRDYNSMDQARTAQTTNASAAPSTTNTTNSHHWISPLPFSPTASKEELEERDMLTTSLGWDSRVEPLEGGNGQPTVQLDFSRFFEPAALDSTAEIMDCDDFSLSSHDANSLSQDLETISKDPASFWEGSMQTASGTDSPTQVSLSSDDHSE